ncbi:MAG: ABC transporter ATP-binding protein [Planctomycetota bacterium]|nr:ABC transporter ATP-binding protein [Planctomycetota bacterium]MDI6787202.1 ABC transporter ATP-binding protein [Planctomycetota bacterium]
MFADLKMFLPYLKRYRWKLLLGILFLGVVDILDVALPLITRYAIDHISAGNVLTILLFCALGYVLVMVLQAIGRFVYRFGFQGTAVYIGRDLRRELFAHTQTLSTNFFNQTKTGDLMSRATNDIEAARHFYDGAIFIATDIILYFLTVPFIMLFLSVKLTILSVITMPILPFFAYWMSTRIHHRFKQIQETFARMSERAQENFAGARVIKSFAQEDNEIKDFAAVSSDYLRKNLALAKLEALFSPTMRLSAGLGMLIVLFFGGMEAIKGTISVGTFVAFPFYLMRLLWPMMALGMTLSIYQRAVASMQRLQEIFNTKPEITSPVNPIKKEIKGRIEFKNVTLIYPSRTGEALKDINLVIPEGRTVAIMGPLGSGKTSLINLITRLYEPSSGEILIDGFNVKQFALDDLSRQIAVVPQDVFLFSMNISDNIGFGISNPPVRAEKIANAARVAMVHNDIENLPDKYQTMLGERGINLSGGQKQRTTIARAVIKDPRILILDDCLSSVDVDTEEAILNNLKDILKKRTSIIISHRLPVIKFADWIIFMEDGQIVETGTHNELLKKKGRYSKFYQHQKILSELEIDNSRENVEGTS